MRLLSISAIFSCDASVRRRPVEYNNSRIIRYRILGADSISFSTSSGLRTTGAFRPSGQSHIVELRVMSLEHLLEEEPQSRHAVLDGSGRQLLVPQHVELELAQLFGPQLVRRFVEVGREVTDGPDVPADGSGGEVSTLELLQHALM